MARGTELAVGYVSLVAETSQLSRGINQALGQAGRDAQQHGTRMGQAMGRGATSGFSFRPNQALSPGIAAAEQTGRQMGTRMGQSTVAQLKQFMTASGIAATGLLGVTAAVGAGMSSAVKSTVDFQTNLNKLQGVTQATGAQMQQVSGLAKQLGSDVNLTGVSAQDAASAMVELTKGGFSVQQAMDAARGTLQLATAAQISAADAATIQADALHAFGLNADQAGKMADILANTANASTGEMNDFAYGLQAGGAVMHQFGLSAEDAASTLGVLANAGIKSSDAGTLVKSMLLALASPSDQAAGALEELNVHAFDAQGNFVGMRSILQQFADAAHRMTPEMYALNTSTALGSDAARIAGIAATQGAEGFDKMRQAVDREGAAAQLAAANTQGLPGVFQRLSNTVDTAKLVVGEFLEGPITKVGNAINTGLNQALDVLQGHTAAGGGLGNLLNAGRDIVPVIGQVASGVGHVVAALGSGAWTTLSTVLSAAATAGQLLLPVLRVGADLIGSNTTALAALAGAWAFTKWVTPALTKMNTALATQATNVRTAASSFAGIATAQGRIVNIAGTGATQLGRFGSIIANIGDHVPVVQRMQTAFFQGAAGAERFGRSAGLAKAGLTGFSTAAGAAVSLMGGPFSAALMAIVTAFTLISGAAQQDKQRTKELAEEQGKLTAAYKEMYDALSLTGGNVDDSILNVAGKQVDILQEKINTLITGPGPGEWLKDVFSPENGDPFAAFSASLDKQHTAESMERIKSTMQDLGLTSQSLSRDIAGGASDWERLESRLRGAGQGGEELLAQLRPLREQFEADQAAAARLTPGVAQLEQNMKTLANSTASAEEKTNALKQALDILAGKAPDQAAAQKTYDDTMRQTAETTQEAIDKTKGFGDALVNANGSVNTATANGSQLYDRLNAIKDATIQVAASGGDLQAAYKNNTIQFQQLASQLGLTETQVRTMAEAMGLVPRNIDTLITVKDDDASRALATIKTELGSVPPGKSITIDAPPDNVVAQLRGIGLQVEAVPGTKPGEPVQIKVTAPTQAAIDELNRLQTQLNGMSNQQLTIQTIMQNISGAPGAPPPPGSYVPYNPADPNANNPLIPPGLRPGQHAEGGAIEGGVAGQDSVPSLLMPGEHVWTTAEVAKAGGHRGMATLRAMARAGLLQAFEQGGPVQPVDPRIAAIDAAYRSAGRPYDFGPWDCSMYMSTIYAAMAGKPAGRYFNTESGAEAFEALGFKRGYKAGALNIGMTHGGPGGGHVAGTLPNGVNVENGPAGMSVYGAGAKGAMDLPDHWYYDGPTAGVNMVTAPSGMPQRPGGPQQGPQYHADWDAMAIKEASGDWHANTGNGFFGGLQFTQDSWAAAGGTAFAARADQATPEQQKQVAEKLLQMQGPGAWPNTFTPAAAPTGSSTVDGTTPGGTTPGAADPYATGGDSTGSARTEGLIPAGAGNSGATGHGLIGGLANLGVSAVNNAIDTAASAAAMGANAFAPGSGEAVQMGAQAAKRLVQYGGEMVGIWGDALIEQLTPFGKPRWLDTDYISAFTPQPRGGTVATTTMEQGAQAAANQVGAPTQPGGQTPPGDQHMAPGQQPGVPVAPGPTPPGPPGVGGTPNGAGNIVTGPDIQPQDPNDPRFKLPFGIFDEGGVLAPSSAAVNMSTQPEMVLTQQQWDALGAGMAGARAPLYPGEQSLDFSTHIQSVQTTDVESLKRELDSRSRLAMMRYAGRR